jgi:DNA-binding GntR family transcriptional regulator
MNGDTAINRASIQHAYQQVADAIAARIEAGYYTIKLRSERDLAEEFGVSYITVRHATAILRQRGLIVSIHGRGTFVASALAGSQANQ